MACLTACVAEALIVYGLKKTVGQKHKNLEAKLGRLVNMLAGGSLLLFVEHVWHGEIVPYYPFLTAANSPAETAQMLHEIWTVGGSMCLAVTAVWGVYEAIRSYAHRETAGEKA